MVTWLLFASVGALIPIRSAFPGCGSSFRDVEIVVNAVEENADMDERIAEWEEKYHMRGSVLRYDDPFEPVVVEDWEVLQ